MITGKFKAITLGLVAFTISLSAVTGVYGQSETFYKGKTIRIIVGFTPGGFYDRWARLLARYMPKYIPGSPEFIVQNMPGAGSIIATIMFPMSPNRMV
jgi:tripartite-type tricarboxylate transporter receptor subunit TctC